jgi:hypothetical protein
MPCYSGGAEQDKSIVLLDKLKGGGLLQDQL